jgi:hypothetical protein
MSAATLWCLPSDMRLVNEQMFGRAKFDLLRKRVLLAKLKIDAVRSHLQCITDTDGALQLVTSVDPRVPVLNSLVRFIVDGKSCQLSKLYGQCRSCYRVFTNMSCSQLSSVGMPTTSTLSRTTQRRRGAIRDTFRLKRKLIVS